jgi:hypothetical protein
VSSKIGVGPVSTSGPAGYRSSSRNWTVLDYLLRWLGLMKNLGGYGLAVGRLVMLNIYITPIL